jgi:hypothetical protein
MRRGVLLGAMGGGWAIVVALTIDGCGAETPADAGLDVEAGASPDGADADWVVDARSERRPPPTYDVVEGGGDAPWCNPTLGPPQGELRTCCGGREAQGEECLGFCVRLEDGGVGCSCYGIAGGCSKARGEACCSGYRGCAAAARCVYIK